MGTQPDTTNATGKKHPLQEKEIGCIKNWKQWKELWKNETIAERLDSLLYFGFGVPVDSYDEAAERICLYLDIADARYECFRSLQSANDRKFSPCTVFGRELTTTADLRMMLVQKAFQMLSQNFFKNTAEKDYHVPSWLYLAAHPQVLDKLFWFFRINEHGYIPNLFSGTGNEDYVGVAKEFALNFCLFAWDCDEPPYVYSREVGEVKKIFQQARLNTIAILCGLGKLDILLSQNRHRKIDEKYLKKIEEIVMNLDLYFPQTGLSYRKPKTIEEACLKSQAAQVLLVLRIQLAEQKRSDDETRRREAEEKINRLNK